MTVQLDFEQINVWWYIGGGIASWTLLCYLWLGRAAAYHNARYWAGEGRLTSDVKEGSQLLYVSSPLSVPIYTLIMSVVWLVGSQKSRIYNNSIPPEYR